MTVIPTNPATSSDSVTRRRHGKELERAILRATWQDLIDGGYARLTMASVASRAQTSEPVLYRRWSNKQQLVFAAIVNYRESHPVETPDTGCLRTDLLAHLSSISECFAGLFAVAVGASFSGLLNDTGMTPAQIREQAMNEPPSPQQRVVFQRAQRRGEVDLERIPSDVLALPFDLVRHDLLLGFEPIAAERIYAIVDDLFIPLVAQFKSPVPGPRS